MKYPSSKNPKPAFFLLLKLYNTSDYKILSRNFYWLHLPGSDYTSLQDPFRKKKIPLKLTTQTFISGRAYEMEVLVQNKSSSSTSSTHKNNFVLAAADDGADYDSNAELQLRVLDGNGKKDGLFRTLSRMFAATEGSSSSSKVSSEVNGSNVGVAFFLQFSVHAEKSRYEEGEDTRILPVHYSDNYFSLVPGEEMTVKLSFEVPPGVTPRVTLHGWNYPGGHTVHH